MMKVYQQSNTKPLMPFRRRCSSSSIALFLLCCRQPHSSAFSTLLSFSPSSHVDGPQRLKFHLFSSKVGIDESTASETTHLPRLYVDNPTLAEQTLINLTPFQSNYLNVMRLSNAKRWGEWAGHVRLFNGNNGEWIAKQVISSEPSTPQKKRRKRQSKTDTTILECVQQTKEQPPEKLSTVHLHMGRLKKQRRKWVLEKVTELGISTIDVIDTEYSTMTDAWEFEKHFTQVIEAAEQCERLTVPSLSETPTLWSDLMELINESNSTQHWLVCRERNKELANPILAALKDIDAKTANGLRSSIHILVGPEGGWSSSELDQLEKLKAETDNLRFVSLGPLVLRAETAAISAVTAIMLSNDQAQ